MGWKCRGERPTGAPDEDHHDEDHHDEDHHDEDHHDEDHHDEDHHDEDNNQTVALGRVDIRLTVRRGSGGENPHLQLHAENGWRQPSTDVAVHLPSPCV